MGVNPPHGLVKGGGVAGFRNQAYSDHAHSKGLAAGQALWLLGHFSRIGATEWTIKWQERLLLRHPAVWRCPA